MNGAEYIAEFLAQVGSTRVCVLTGGACTFMIDTVARHPALHHTCFQHEQSAAMAADGIHTNKIFRTAPKSSRK
jgi:acetolactate synthase-1/2/3 large subunit